MKSFIKNIFSKETILYIVYGMGTSVVDFVTFTVFVNLGASTITSNNIAWCLAVIFAFVTNKLFVFKSRSSCFKLIAKEFLLFISARLFTLICSDIILHISDTLKFNVLIAKIFAMIFTVLLNYIFSKLIIFRKAETDD